MLCLTSVHIDCYDFPDGNAVVEYSMVDDSRLQRIAMYRFSHIQPNGSASGSMIDRCNCGLEALTRILSELLPFSPYHKGATSGAEL